MTTTHPHSAVIEQMRRQRATPTSVRDGDATPSLRRLESASTIGFAASLRQLNAGGRLARLLGNDDPEEVRAVLDELASLLARIGYHWRSALASKAQRNRRTVRRSRASMQPTTKRGRTRGSVNFAARQLGLGLAVIWNEQTGRPPSRRESRPGSHRPSYPNFVAAIAVLVPMLFRKTEPSALPDVEYLVRVSIRDYRAAMAAPEEYRRRGLLDEQQWLDAARGSAQQVTQP
jgi:hypothetical protein